MARNRKLTGVLKGRTVQSAQSQGEALKVGFTDGSTMAVRTGGAMDQALTGGTVRAVRQQGTRMNLDFENGSTMEIHLAEETSSVMVRDKEGKLEYAD